MTLRLTSFTFAYSRASEVHNVTVRSTQAAPEPAAVIHLHPKSLEIKQNTKEINFHNDEIVPSTLALSTFSPHTW